MKLLFDVSWARWLPGLSLVHAFRRDRLFLVTFAILSLGALSPLFVTPILPFPDLSGNVASASLLVHTALKHLNADQYYRVDWLPFPYWTTYLLLGTLNLVVGPFIAAKALVALLVVLLPLSLMRFLLATGRDPRMSLWGFLISWEHNLYAGWHSYVLAMALSFVVLAKVVEATDERAALRVVPWSVFLALTHAMAVIFVLLAALFLIWDGRGVMRRAKLHAIALSGSALMLVPWLTARLRSFGSQAGGGRVLAEYPTISEKVTGFFAFSLDNLSGPFGEWTAGLAMMLLILGPLALACLGRNDSTTHRWSGAMVAMAALTLYVTLPMAFYGPVDHWYTYPRYASYFLAGLLLVPPIQVIPWAALAPGVVVALAGNAATVNAFVSFGDRVRPFLQIFDAVPPGTRLLPLEYVDRDPVVKFAPLAHLHSYITAKVLFDPHLFDNPNTPIRYKANLSIPRISFLGPTGFTLAKYAPHYDYILVQGSDRDPFVDTPSDAGFHVRLQREAGMWRLYAVVRE